jgi:alpha-ribazole phosphatase
MKLVLLRHAQTTAADGLCYGRTDVTVRPEVSRALAARLAGGLPAEAAMLCSPLSRCTDLAREIASLRPDLQPMSDARLAEMDFGEWEGRSWSSIARADMDDWLRDVADGRAGVSGESTRAFMQRVGVAFDAWRAGGRDAVWVTHAGVIRAVRLLHGGMRSIERADQWPAEPIAFGACVAFEA